MNKRRAQYYIFTIFSLWFGSTFSCNATAVNRVDQIQVVTEPLPPYQIVKEGEVQGLVAEKVRKLLRELGSDSHTRAMPWARAYKTALTEPGTLIFSMVRTPAREELFHWLGVLVSTKTYLIALKKRDNIKLNDLEGLINYKTGVKRDDVVFHYLSKKDVLSKAILLPDTITTVKMLLRGRVDIIAASPIHLDYMCSQIGCKSSDFQFLLELDELSSDFYLAANKHMSPELVDLITNKLKKLAN
ncbi:substrate-binding periplasmic protein [Pseudoalteromonas peptidolytica]|uniref:Polar amino acid transport system substrate-binding protein n=1 Tax=Pseudoalteromonas peptidolytica F12-50-A1 TaxID=1315280 RepID=A0A8I0MZN9_9GAMM|nr:transporter substrate-binding domain-containing protein [Pseudoalteromonas peptidolytica]MBE0349087.1 polar amino acid transport system substrate-binding protein [Pseudoalteromonas peptidolytica F12-50-A1]NLR17062.1 transporter substrate-binding domain-containing protein [Pseudoalteromonas peptidolytica]